MGSIATQRPTYDVLIIGAGLSGIYSLYNIRKQFPSWSVKVIEAGEGAGGTWYWNRYPGARTDTESISYGYSWDRELLDEWDWNDAFSSQADNLRYLERVCEKNDLYKDIQFGTRIVSAHWQGESHSWVFVDDKGQEYETTFFVSCMGFLSSPTLPDVTGIDTFAGQVYHTARWPKNFDISRDFAGKRIGVIGTGATGIQTITEVGKEPGIASLHVFQRTATWTVPLRNTSTTLEDMVKIKTEYDTTFRRCKDTPMGFLYKPDKRRTVEVTEEERRQFWEKLYAEPGFGKWLGVFSDTYTDRTANKMYSDFIADKIRSRVADPSTAEKLIPTKHGFGTRRVPLESGYFETFNKPNVHLVDLQENPVVRMTPRGILTADNIEHNLDVLICATGFDAITGAFSAIEWHAKDDRSLIEPSSSVKGKRAIWPDHKPRTFLGITIPAMPNTFMCLGPHQPFGNATRNIEHAVTVITDLLQYCKDNDYTYVEPTAEAVESWTEHVIECSKGLLTNEVDSWLTGVNKNVKGKQVRSVARYSGHANEYRRRCAECKQANWQGLVFQ